ncbi:MAG: hypothetical protein WHT47_06105 [Hydrogenothermaceae bacterium]
MENNVVSLQLSHSMIGEKGKKKKVSSSSFFDILFYREKTSKNDNTTSTTLNSKKDKNKDKHLESSIKVQSMDNYMNISEAFAQTDKVKNLTLSANENHKDIKVVNNPENLSFTKTKLSDMEKIKLLSDTTLNRSQKKEGSINSMVKERQQKTEDLKSKQVNQEKINEKNGYQIIKEREDFNRQVVLSGDKKINQDTVLQHIQFGNEIKDERRDVGNLKTSTQTTTISQTGLIEVERIKQQKTEDVKSKQINQEKINENITGKKLQNRDLLTVSVTNLVAKEPKIREDIKPKLKELFENSNYEMIKRNESVNTISNVINFEVVEGTVSVENTGILQNIKIQESINVNIDVGQSGQSQFGLVNLIDVRSSDSYDYDHSSQNQGQSGNQSDIQSEVNQNKFNLTFNYLDTKISIQSINNGMIMYLTTEQQLNPQIIQNIQKILTENGLNNHNLIIRDKTKITKVYSSKVNISDNVRSDGFRISA